MTNLESFAESIPEFNTLSSSAKIDFFLYFHTIIEKHQGASSASINGYYDQLKIIKYSNTSQYLSQGAKKTKGKVAKFIYQRGLYHLERLRKTEIDELLNVPKIIEPTNNYFPQELFNETRGYLKKLAAQAAGCYDMHLFDACSVMTRKILEVLIIEAFERYKIANKVKNDKGNFFYLSDLIDLLTLEKTWNIGRNAKAALPSLKKMGDQSAHNRRYMATKSDIDKSKDDLRIVLEELIHLIDYSTWHL